MCYCMGKIYYGTWMSIIVSANNQRFVTRDSDDVIQCSYKEFGFKKK